MTRPDPNEAVAQAEANLARLLDRREAALDGAGHAPDPRVIKAAESALEAARAKLAKQEVAA